SFSPRSTTPHARLLKRRLLVVLARRPTVKGRLPIRVSTAVFVRPTAVELLISLLRCSRNRHHTPIGRGGRWAGLGGCRPPPRAGGRGGGWPPAQSGVAGPRRDRTGVTAA